MTNIFIRSGSRENIKTTCITYINLYSSLIFARFERIELQFK